MVSSVFVDSNVIFSATLSKSGAPRRILRLAAGGVIRLVISQQVEREVCRNLEMKVFQVAHLYPVLLHEANIVVVPDPSEETVREMLPYVRYWPDAMILAAAKEVGVDFFVTGDVKHFLSAAELKNRVAFEILSPAEFLQRLESSQSI
jgi:predicted nucleic acid-binding protein